jgi:hypothetical protein
MSPKDDDTSLGYILHELGVISKEQLDSALEKQRDSTIEQLLGMVLVHEGYCKKDDIEMALSAQKSLRNGSNRKDVRKALAAMDFAITKKKSNGSRLSTIRKAAEFYRHRTGQGFPAVLVKAEEK